MTYLELINSFWKAAEFNKWSANDIMVYLFLLHNCNIRRWSNPFELPTSVIENRFSLSRQAITNIRKRLEDRELILCSKGSRNQNPVYLIRGADITDKRLALRFASLADDMKADTSVDTEVDTDVDTKADTQVDTYNKNKIKDKEKNINKTRDQIHSIFGEDDFGRWKDAVCSRFKIPEENLSRLAAQFAEEAACRGWTIGPAEKSTRSLFTTWLERRVSKQKSNNFNPQQYGTNNIWYRPQGLAARMPHTPRHGLIE